MPNKHSCESVMLGVLEQAYPIFVPQISPALNAIISSELFVISACDIFIVQR